MSPMRAYLHQGSASTGGVDGTRNPGITVVAHNHPSVWLHLARDGSDHIPDRLDGKLVGHLEPDLCGAWYTRSDGEVAWWWWSKPISAPTWSSVVGKGESALPTAANGSHISASQRLEEWLRIAIADGDRGDCWKCPAFACRERTTTTTQHGVRRW